MINYLGNITLIIFINKLRFSPRIMYKLKKMFTFRILRMAYFSFFQSHLQYCITSYGNAFNSTLKPLAVIQRKCLKFMSNKSLRAETSNLFKNANILNFNGLYYYRTLCHLKKHFISFNFILARSSRINLFTQDEKRNTTRGQMCMHWRSVILLNAIKCNINNQSKANLKKISFKMMNAHLF